MNLNLGSMEKMNIEDKSPAITVNTKLEKLFIGADKIKNMNFTEIDFLVDKLIPKATLCALVGESDTGKSSLLRQLAVSIVCDEDDFLGFKIKESCRNVIYVSTEDGDMATSVWLNKYFTEEFTQDAKLSRLKFIYSVDGIISNLKKVVTTNCVDLIIVDSYADLFSGSMNNSNEVRSFLNLYDSIVKEFGVTVVFLHHTKKASSGMIPNKNSILGSQGFEAKMRSVMMLIKDRDEPSLRHLCIVKNNYMTESNKNESYVLNFNDQLSFVNTGERVQIQNLGEEDWLPKARKLKAEGVTLEEIVKILAKEGVKTSTSSLSRKFKQSQH